MRARGGKRLKCASVSTHSSCEVHSEEIGGGKGFIQSAHTILVRYTQKRREGGKGELVASWGPRESQLTFTSMENPEPGDTTQGAVRSSTVPKALFCGNVDNPHSCEAFESDEE